MKSPVSSRLAALRAEMEKSGIDAFVVPRADEFLGEYVPACNERLSWVSGFTGSAGVAVVTAAKAAFFTDGRYTLQALQQVPTPDFEIYSISEGQELTPTLRPEDWIAGNLPKDGVLGLYAWVHTPNSLADRGDKKGLRSAAGGRVKLLDSNPLDAAWTDRPPAPQTPAVPHPLEFSGVASTDKRAALATALKGAGAKALAVMLPEEVCWLLNIRGDDVPRTPFCLSYAIAHDDGTLDWFVDAGKVTDEVRGWLDAGVRIHALGDFSGALESLAKTGAKIWIDPSAAPVRVQEIVTGAGGATHEAESPVQLMKAQKNPVEIEGAINAHIRDGVAETRFLSRILAPGAAAKHDEITASDLLESLRAEGERFRGLSFDTISGAGGNGAIVHYRAEEATKKPLLAGPVYLVDSGGQYLDGTTDITRTVAVEPAKVTAEMKKHFTLVLKGHIQVAISVFPEGTTGKVLDEKARAALKAEGLDYAHGTGHGVGSYLSVHEGPCSISSLSTRVPLMPGMILSNEPGYYKTGEYGIRIENLVLVTDTGETDGEGRRLFAFQTLTQAPIDLALVDASLLEPVEEVWLNDYHAGVWDTLSPLLDGDPAARDFLRAATQTVS